MLLPTATGTSLPTTGIGLPTTVASLVVGTASAKAAVVEAAGSVLVNGRVGALGLVVSHLLAVGALDAGDWKCG